MVFGVLDNIYIYIPGISKSLIFWALIDPHMLVHDILGRLKLLRLLKLMHKCWQTMKRQRERGCT